MISHPSFQVEPWCLRESSLDLDILAQSESLFALSNGHIGLRGNLDEGEPNGTPGTYLNAVYERRPLPYGESGYGYPESSESVINVTNGKIFRLLVDDEPFDVRYGTVLDHERCLDFRAGTLARTVTWRSPAEATVRVRTVRLVSLSQRSVAAIRYEVEAVDTPVRVVLQSELVANEFVPEVEGDPRVAVALDSPLVAEEHEADHCRSLLIHRTKQSGLRVAAAMDHDVDGPGGTTSRSESIDDVARITVTSELAAGERLQLTKYLAYGWSATRSRPAIHDQVLGALFAARTTGWDELLNEQRACLDEFWSGADVELEGDPEVQQAVRFALFHVFQASFRSEHRAIPAKGLTGPGYDGHAFWDTETFVLPVLTYTHPPSVKDALDWRRSTLDQAEERARQLGFEGATFPWRTISGQECSSYWPAGTAAFHVNADIAAAVVRYLDATCDEEFEKATAFDLLVATARLWRSLGHHDREGRFRIDGVTGPDEYSAVSDNNVFTNLMAARNLLEAARLAVAHDDVAARFDVSVEEVASWRDAGEKIFIPFDSRLGVHPQAEGFTEHDQWDFVHTGTEQYPLFLHFPYFDLYRKQVVKQPDLVLAMYLCDDAFTPEEKLRNFAYYDAITVRDSSLSASIQAVLAAEVGALGLAYDYLGEAALIDLDDREHNTRDGLHLASLAGTWTALVAGFGGLRFRDGHPAFSPRLPEELTKLRFTLRYRGRRLSVTIEPDKATYELLEGDPIDVFTHGARLELHEDPVEAALPPLGAPPEIAQPQGRAPLHRHRSHPD
ncbi:MAG: glycoside hydrolase family 65 protein [Acidimicrobiales bacterium]